VQKRIGWLVCEIDCMHALSNRDKKKYYDGCYRKYIFQRNPFFQFSASFLKYISAIVWLEKVCVSFAE
jgi:hypothetical protein